MLKIWIKQFSTRRVDRQLFRTSSMWIRQVILLAKPRHLQLSIINSIKSLPPRETMSSCLKYGPSKVKMQGRMGYKRLKQQVMDQVQLQIEKWGKLHLKSKHLSNLFLIQRIWRCINNFSRGPETTIHLAVSWAEQPTWKLIRIVMPLWWVWD